MYPPVGEEKVSREEMLEALTMLQSLNVIYLVRDHRGKRVLKLQQFNES
jgi:hypothetical protein